MHLGFIIVHKKNYSKKKNHFEAGGVAHILGSLTTMQEAQS